MGFICLIFVKIWTNMQEKQTSVCICTLFTTWGCICTFSIPDPCLESNYLQQKQCGNA